jgi:tRNA threonylcarbamoyladenosine modification (KEOPS) complex  Pcc1 subunit
MQPRDSSKKQKINAYAEITINKHPKINYKKVLALPSTRAYARSSTEIKEDKGRLKIVIKAEDITALRASINSIMRDLQVIAAIDRLEKKTGRIPQKVKIYKNIE